MSERVSTFGKLFLAPHNDDEVLFGFFTLLKERPQIVICLQGDLQEARGENVTAQQRTDETSRAAFFHDCPWDQWKHSDLNPDWPALEKQLRGIAPRYDKIWAPAIEEDGHEQHSRVGELADLIWPGQVTHYHTYRRGHGKTRSAREVPFTPDEMWKKLRAIACFKSQIAVPSTAYWFIDETQREWLQDEPETH